MCIRDSYNFKWDKINDLNFLKLKVWLDKAQAHNIGIANSGCLLYTSDAADERSSVDLGGRRIIKKKNKYNARCTRQIIYT